MTSRPTAHTRFDIPKVAWHRGIGLPLADAGRSRVIHEVIIDDGPWGGVPLGGLGAGSIGRTHRGDFARWHLDIGTHRFETIPACQFSVFVARGRDRSAHVLSTVRPETPSAWNWDLPVGAGRYHGLFPRAWFEIDWDALPVRLSQLQFSPVIPHNYRESSYPVALFEWRVENPGPEPLTVGLMFTWQNLVGRWNDEDRRGGHRNEAIRRDGLAGVVLSGPPDAAAEAWAGSFAIVAPEEAGTRLSLRSRFSVDDGADVWADFATDGRLDDVIDPAPSRPGEAIGAALAATVELAPGEARIIPFALAWDFPVAEFGSGRRWFRRYTRFFGRAGGAAWPIAAEALARRAEWEAAIEAWQAPILADPGRPDWYKTALLNELYFLVDGGTFWADGRADVGEPVESEAAGPEEIGPFALIECFDYPFYNTLDVHFYASFALLHLWPELERRVLRDFVTSVGMNDPEIVTISATGQPAIRKRSGALPHDLGGPPEDPFIRLNHYRLEDVNVWKDLNTKFVLLVWRDGFHLRDDDLIRESWPAVVQALDYAAAFDRNGDGLLDHESEPDQTYDTWRMRGPSAYCSSLWLAALRAALAMGELVGDVATTARYRERLECGLAAFESRLWTGSYYAFDGGDGPSSDSIMADQLAGQWYADATGLEPIASDEHIREALHTIYRLNVHAFAGGTMGAVNGMSPRGTVDASSEQSQEVWVGTTYALAAFMIGRGMVEEGWRTAWGAYSVTYERGYWFRTPEAYDRAGNFRASLYLRPLSVWAIEHALRRLGLGVAGRSPVGPEPDGREGPDRRA